MAQLTRRGSLELEEDLPFQQWQWRSARALWVVLVALMAATAAGFFGSGPLSRRRAGATDAPLWAEYERVARFGASIRLVVHARPQSDGEVRFRLDRSLLDAFRIQHVIPAPSATTVVGNGVEYRFQTGVNGPVAVIFEMQSATRWSVEGEIESADSVVRLKQFILP